MRTHSDNLDCTKAVIGRRRERGQSLAVALIVMFVLLFIGGLFVAMVARNLLNSGRATDTIEALRLSQAGYAFAARMLENSPEGADWRPLPPGPPPTAAALLNIYNADPDRRWLDAGYTRIPLGNGRALIRVEYTPDPRSPMGKYIRIRSVGRVGTVTTDDPTTFVDPTTGTVSRLRREQLAVKQIGLTDYLLFVTNPARDATAQAAIGMPDVGVPSSMELGGNPLASTFANRFNGWPGTWNLPSTSLVTTGAPMQINEDALFMGTLTLGVLKQYDLATGGTPATAQYPWSAEAIRVNGNILTSGANVQVKDLVTNTVGAVLPSSNAAFNTWGGILRDGVGTADAFGYSRDSTYVTPPTMDSVDTSTGVARYTSSTRESGIVMQRPGPGGTSFNTGQYGLGAGLYIDNFNNFERESEVQDGGQSLRSIWMNPGSTQYWSGPYYIPPGAFIEFGSPVAPDRDPTTAAPTGTYSAQPGFRVVRDASDQPFRDPNGNVATREQAFTFFIYKPAGQRPVIKLDNAFFRSFLLNTGLTNQAIDALLPAFNGVIYAEGNIRVRGILASRTNAAIPMRRALPAATDPDGTSDAQVRSLVNPPSVTVVSGATIYIEGPLVREDPSSMIALLAHDYVTVNTTLFVAPNKGMAWNGTSQDEVAPFHTTIGISEAAQTPPFAVDFLNGDDLTGYGSSVYLLARHGAPTGTSFLNLLVNESRPVAGENPFYTFGIAATPPVPPYVLSVTAADTTNGSDGFRQQAFGFTIPAPGPSGNLQYNFFTGVGDTNTLRPQVDPNFTNGSPTQDYLLGRYAVVPMDVRIEAVMFAQTGSFFIIPGYSVNPNPNDTRQAALSRAAALGLPAGTYVRPTGTDDMFPFFGEPIDCRITVVGAISEAKTASIGDQTAWMQLWGYIPDHHGSSSIAVPVAHANVDEVGGAAGDQRTPAEQSYYGAHGGITRGLRFLYDPALLAPYPAYTPLVNDRASNPLSPQYEQPNTWFSTTQTNPATTWVNTAAGTFRQDDYGRYLPPMPRLPVCPGFVYVGEERLAGLF